MIRQSVFIKGVITFLIVYTIYSICFLIYEIDASYDIRETQSKRVARNYLKIGKILLKAGEISDLTDRLDDAMQAHEIDYYYLRKNKEDVAFASAAGADDPILFTEVNENMVFETAEYRHFYMLEGPYTLVIGHKKSVFNYVRIFFDLNKSLIANDLIFVSLIVLALMLYSFRDLRSILGSLRKRKVSRTDLSVAKSSETLTLVQGLIGYQANVETLAKENALLKGQILPALKKELTSGRPIPYEFGCTLVRTDINNFTTIFTTHDRAQFMQMINEFFVGVTHIVSRYKGYVYEFIGDEVIFYFKDEDHLNSPAIAISALREINDLANEMSERTDEFGYAFKVKSSLAWGTLRFGPLVNGFSLAGRPLIETVRLLTHVHEKSENTILFEESIADRISFIATSREQGVVLLKGLSQSRKLRIHEAYIPLSYQLRQEDVKHFEFMTYYRSDRDICETLDYIRKNVGQVDKKLLQKLLLQFRDFRVTELSVDIRKSYVECLERLVALCEKNQWAIEDDVFMLSTLVAAASELFPAEKPGEAMRAALMRCLEVPDRRVIANALDVFANLESDAGDEVFTKLASFQDNRIAANALIKQAKLDWDRTTAKRLGAMMRMKSPYYKASALFALGEIAEHLRALDSVSYFTDSTLQGFLDELPVFVEHANKMVRRQALKVFRKAAREAELVELLKDTSIDAEVRGEIRLFLSEVQSAPASVLRVA